MRDTNYMAPVSVPLNQRSTGTGGRLLGRIYEAIQNRLLEGEYPAGTKLSVEAIRAEFGVSKQPVMEALRLLSADGLVEIFPANRLRRHHLLPGRGGGLLPDVRRIRIGNRRRGRPTAHR